MKVDIFSLFCIGLLGTLLLYSYYYYGTTNKKNADKLWGGINSYLKTFYIISMCLSAIGFLTLLSYLFKSTSLTSLQASHIVIGLVCIIIFSLFWMPLSLYYLKNGSSSLSIQYTIIAVLLSVAFASLYSLTLINNIKEKTNTIHKQIAVIGMSYFFFHTFVLDSLLWSYNFF